MEQFQEGHELHSCRMLRRIRAALSRWGTSCSPQDHSPRPRLYFPRLRLTDGSVLSSLSGFPGISLGRSSSAQAGHGRDFMIPCLHIPLSI
jgi:hypothetical protein